MGGKYEILILGTDVVQDVTTSRFRTCRLLKHMPSYKQLNPSPLNPPWGKIQKQHKKKNEKKITWWSITMKKWLFHCKYDFPFVKYYIVLYYFLIKCGIP